MSTVITCSRHNYTSINGYACPDCEYGIDQIAKACHRKNELLRECILFVRHSNANKEIIRKLIARIRKEVGE